MGQVLQIHIHHLFLKYANPQLTFCFRVQSCMEKTTLNRMRGETELLLVIINICQLMS
jgi:hypothetical protein